MKKILLAATFVLTFSFVTFAENYKNTGKEYIYRCDVLLKGKLIDHIPQIVPIDVGNLHDVKLNDNSASKINLGTGVIRAWMPDKWGKRTYETIGEETKTMYVWFFKAGEFPMDSSYLLAARIKTDYYNVKTRHTESTETKVYGKKLEAWLSSFAMKVDDYLLNCSYIGYN